MYLFWKHFIVENAKFNFNGEVEFTLKLDLNLWRRETFLPSNYDSKCIKTNLEKTFLLLFPALGLKLDPELLNPPHRLPRLRWSCWIYLLPLLTAPLRQPLCFTFVCLLTTLFEKMLPKHAFRRNNVTRRRSNVRRNLQSSFR